MGKAFDTRQVEYAYVREFAVLPNIDVPAVIVDGVVTEPASFKSRISITYELKTADKILIEYKAIEHWINHPTKLNTTQIKNLVNDNLKPFVSADKLELSGFMEV